MSFNLVVPKKELEYLLLSSFDNTQYNRLWGRTYYSIL